MKNRNPVTILGLALLASAPASAGIKGKPVTVADLVEQQSEASLDPAGRSPASQQAQAPFVEKAPENNDPEKRVPKYIRINVAGYNVRSDTDFDVNKNKNVDHKTTKGALYAVTRVQKMQRGLAVGVYDGGQERWIYVPNWRKNDFQFCESEACFADLAAVLKILDTQEIAPSKLSECGIALGDSGEVLDASLPLKVDPVALPKPRPKPVVAKLDQRVRPTRTPPAAAPAPAPSRQTASFELARRPVWENNNRDLGRRWTAQLSESLDRYGKGLLSRKTLGDASEWCPNYSRLSDVQRKEFWMHVIPAMSRFESGYTPTATYDEKTGKNPRRGRVNPRTYSQGLTQLSYHSAGMRPYREFCKFDWSRDQYKDVSDPSLTIYDTKKQLDCAVGIMNKWISKDGSIGGPSNRGAARFWSTFRYSNPKTKKVKELARRYGPCSGR